MFSFARLQTGTKNIAIEDFTLENCRGVGILGNSVSDITIKHMEIRNTGYIFTSVSPGSQDNILLAHVSRRLKGEVIVYQSSCRLCVCVCLCVSLCVCL